MTDPQEHVLAALRANTNEYQGEWTSQRTRLPTLVADESLSRDGLDETLNALLDAGRIETNESGEFRLADAELK